MRHAQGVANRPGTLAKVVKGESQRHLLLVLSVSDTEKGRALVK